MELLAYVLLFTGMLMGLIMIPLGLPGTGAILLGTAAYAWLTQFAIIGAWSLVVLTALTIISETADNWLTAVGAKRYGGSTGSMWVSIIGALLGALFLGTPLAFLLGPLGPIAGGFAGAFGSVLLFEWMRTKDIRAALRTGWGTLVGRAAGIVLKFVIGIGMVIGILLRIVLGL